MKLITITFAVLSVVPQFNYQPPTMDTPRSNEVVSNFVIGEKQAQFPDRSNEAEIAKQIDVQREQARLAEIKRLEAIEAQKQVSVPQAPQKPVTVAQNSSEDANSAKMFIYMKESGNNPQARNASGCLGIGQACPGSKLLAVCPNLDYACQDAFFTNYAMSRYGSWENALAFWQRNNWW